MYYFAVLGDGWWSLCVCVCASVEKKAGLGRLYLSPLWLAFPSVVCCSFPYPHGGVFCLPLSGFPFESRVGIQSFTASEFIPEAVENLKRPKPQM